MAYVATGDLTKWHVAMDNCTDVSIFCNRSLLKDVESSAVLWTITGHARGAEIVLDEVGAFHGFSAMYSERASCNELCQHDVAKSCDTFEIPEWGIRVMSEDGPLDFVLCGKRYVLDVRRTKQISDGEFK
jgi:hypothetical protein